MTIGRGRLLKIVYLPPRTSQVSPALYDPQI